MTQCETCSEWFSPICVISREDTAACLQRCDLKVAHLVGEKMNLALNDDAVVSRFSVLDPVRSSAVLSYNAFSLQPSESDDNIVIPDCYEYKTEKNSQCSKKQTRSKNNNKRSWPKTTSSCLLKVKRFVPSKNCGLATPLIVHACFTAGMQKFCKCKVVYLRRVSFRVRDICKPPLKSMVVGYITNFAAKSTAYYIQGLVTSRNITSAHEHRQKIKVARVTSAFKTFVWKMLTKVDKEFKKGLTKEGTHFHFPHEFPTSRFGNLWLASQMWFF